MEIKESRGEDRGQGQKEKERGTSKGEVRAEGRRQGLTALWVHHSAVEDYSDTLKSVIVSGIRLLGFHCYNLRVAGALGSGKDNERKKVSRRKDASFPPSLLPPFVLALSCCQSLYIELHASLPVCLSLCSFLSLLKQTASYICLSLSPSPSFSLSSPLFSSLFLRCACHSQCLPIVLSVLSSLFHAQLRSLYVLDTYPSGVFKVEAIGR